jgi:hypothetical protein
MANYRNPIDIPNPFWTTPLTVLVVRNVRIHPTSGEAIMENPNTVQRHIQRVSAQHVYPRRQVALPAERNIPNSFARKVEYH